MRKYIIVPVLLAVVLVMMCHCTSDRKATVPANEYLIQGELANLSDSIVKGCMWMKETFSTLWREIRF